MTSEIFKIILFLILLSSQIHPQSLSDKIDAALEDSLFSVSLISINVYDLTANKSLYRKNEKLLLRPASNLKLFTNAAALYYLDDDINFTTPFFIEGELIDSVLNGNLYVKGGFDPLFTVNDFDSVVNQLKSIGIKNITGNFFYDVSNIDSLYFGKGWMWDDNSYSFMPYLSSLCINKNSVKVYFEPSKIGDPAVVELNPISDYYSVTNNLFTTIEDTSNIKIERDWLGNKNHVILSGDISYSKRPDSTSLNIINPPEFFANLFVNKLTENGIVLEGEILSKPVLAITDTLMTVKRNMMDVITETNRESDNLSAEMLLRKISYENSKGSASAKKGLRYIDSLIVELGFKPKTFVFADGSGLSHYNLISTELVIELLKFMYYDEPEIYGKIFETLPTAGVDGTLKYRMKFGNAYKNVKAKTGTISGVSTLSGYLTAANNHLIAFSIFIQNYSGSAKRARQIQDNICNILVNHK
ncbi:MAG: D-alanyl-D-alanine carboxypeptidase/D-alanyl-D-alanine-endopeptidase [Melioribacteraceae bacterium]|nr:D-alanyl-D-alanine carboxypeptidase/D-alanyl-D-alanine-endopeptidase [Melioribacteraceae bacterium]